MNIEEIKMDHFESFEELIKTCKMWIRDDDIDAYYRFFEFNCMKALLTAYEKEKRLAETNLKDSEEFQDNMCNHRCILNSKVEELKQELEKEKEKNKELNKYIEDRAKIGKNIQTFINKDYVEQEYISKDKIKAKIEELKQKKYILSSRDSEIEILQSLLEKE